MKTFLVIIYHSLSAADPSPDSLRRIEVYEKPSLGRCLRDARQLNREMVVTDDNGVTWRIEAFCSPKINKAASK